MSARPPAPGYVSRGGRAPGTWFAIRAFLTRARQRHPPPATGERTISTRLRSGSGPVSARGSASARVRVAGLGVVVAACSGDSSPTGGGSSIPPPSARFECSIPATEIFSGGVDRGQIPDLTEPKLVPAGHPETGYLLDTDRVIGLRVGDEWVAVPHNILWWHEIVHFNRLPSLRLAVTYCPLTGSSLVFDRRKVNRFIVSGLLFNNNLMMLDQETESLWPQMSLAARCGPRDGEDLATYPSLEMTWAGWRALHPDTKVVSRVTGFTRDYTLYPYDLYESPNAPPLFDIPSPDRRRAFKERVLGVRGASEPGVAFPFFELAAAGGPVAAQDMVDGERVLVLWDADAKAAAAYRPVLDGQPLTFEVAGGAIRDLETGSEWGIEGRALVGPLAGRALEPITDAYVAFWFAWSAFHKGTRIWTAG